VSVCSKDTEERLKSYRTHVGELKQCRVEPDFEDLPFLEFTRMNSAPTILRKKIEDLREASASSPIVPSILGHEARSGISPRGEGQDGTFALNFLARAASVVSHWISRSVPVRNRSIHSGGSTEKSIVWRPQSGRRPS
jgi:hypothetical protein